MIQNIVLGTSETTIYQTGSGEQFAVLSMVFCNTSSSQVTITVYTYPDGGTAGDGTTIVKDYAIDPNDSFIWTANEKFILGSLDKISGLASAGSAITVTVNGLGI